MITSQLIINLLLILLVAWLFGSIFARFGLPVMLGELLAGIILGPTLLDIVHESLPLDLFADLGIFFVMFYTGMEMDPKELLAHIRPSMAVAIGGFILPYALGYGVTMLFGGTVFQSLVMGLGISITALAVQAVVLQALNINRTDIGSIIIGAAIADDILSLVALSVILGLAKTGTIHLAAVVIILLKVALFFGMTILVGHFVMPHLTKKMHDREGKAFTFALAAALIMAYLAEKAGLHLVIGAFLAGQFVREEIMDPKIYNVIRDRFYGLSYGFLLPIFFASLSFHLHLKFDWSMILFSLVITVVAVVGKLVGCGAGLYVFRKNPWEAAVVGFGMNGRGAVELVIASVVLSLSNELLANGTISETLITQDQFSALILMAFITTFMAPITMKWAVMKTCSSAEGAQFCKLWDRGGGGG